MTMVASDLRRARAVRARMDVATLDYRRTLRELKRSGYSQGEIARVLGLSQPAVSGALRTAEKAPEPVPGFSGASPLEIAKRYAAGLLSREETIDQLVRWEYTPFPPSPSPIEITWVDPPGTWNDVELAYDLGLLDDDLIDEVIEERERSGIH